MKIPFLSHSAKDLPSCTGVDSGESECTCSIKEDPVPITYCEEFKNFLNKNMPADFDKKLQRASPFIITSFIAWPLYWVYRGVDWGRKRKTQQIKPHIQRTFVQAKAIQFAIITAGLLYAIYEPNNEAEEKEIEETPRNMRNGGR